MEQHDRDDRRILIEGRDRVTALRLGSLSELADDIATLGKELARNTDIEFRCDVVGDQRELHPIAHEESFFIVREALINAFRHSRATHIAVHVLFDRHVLCIEIQDDGRGFAPEILESGGVKNHWGLVGMPERAARISSTVRIGNRVEGGALVELRVPASVAYE
ncbi:sensor histidine kinase [Povalibacter sp.]|uniref:sensor histidine kinase n=1 Tax=Povalibacter sp. TaxID=1962978 RepID=UPI002F3F71EF